MSQPALPEYKNSEKMHACPFCDRRFLDDNILHKHKFTHAKERYLCDICDQTYPSKQALLKHQLPLHKKLVHQAPEKLSHTCKDCNKGFVHRGNFLKHRAKHTKSKTAECKVSSEIQLHDTNAKRFSCEFCQKSYTQKFKLKQHCSEHFGQQKVYSCEICNKTFSQKPHLKNHYLTHTGEKPHKCELCDKGFAVIKSLRIHLATHGNESPYKCDWCEKFFRQKSYLRTHAKLWCSVKRSGMSTSRDFEAKPETLSN